MSDAIISPLYCQVNAGGTTPDREVILTIVQLRVTSCPGQADSPLAGRTGWSVTVSTIVFLVAAEGVIVAVAIF